MDQPAYEPINDIFCIHNGFDKDETFKTNLMFGDLILDITDKDHIVGIEVLNASMFFKDFGITQSMLNCLQGSSFSSRQTKSGSMIEIHFKFKDRQITIPTLIAIPEMCG